MIGSRESWSATNPGEKSFRIVLARHHPKPLFNVRNGTYMEMHTTITLHNLHQGRGNRTGAMNHVTDGITIVQDGTDTRGILQGIATATAIETGRLSPTNDMTGDQPWAIL